MSGSVRRPVYGVLCSKAAAQEDREVPRSLLKTITSISREALSDPRAHEQACFMKTPHHAVTPMDCLEVDNRSATVQVAASARPLAKYSRCGSSVGAWPCRHHTHGQEELPGLEKSNPTTWKARPTSRFSLCSLEARVNTPPIGTYTTRMEASGGRGAPRP